MKAGHITDEQHSQFSKAYVDILANTSSLKSLSDLMNGTNPLIEERDADLQFALNYTPRKLRTIAIELLATAEALDELKRAE